MEQLISTPVKPGELILGKLVPYFVIGMCDVLLAVLMGQFVFHVPCAATWRCCSASSAIFLVGTLSMGMLDQHRHQEPVALQPGRRGGHLPAGVSALGVHLHDRQHAAGDPDGHLHRAGAVFRGDSEGHLPEGSGLEILAGQVRVAGRCTPAAMVLLARLNVPKQETDVGFTDDVRAHQAHADQGVHPGLPRPADADRDLRDPLRAGAGDRLRRLDRRETRARRRFTTWTTARRAAT